MSHATYFPQKKRKQTESTWRRKRIIKCALCGMEKETNHHLFLRCAVSRVVWRESLRQMEITTIRRGSKEIRINMVLHPESDLGIPRMEKHYF